MVRFSFSTLTSGNSPNSYSCHLSNKLSTIGGADIPSPEGMIKTLPFPCQVLRFSSKKFEDQKRLNCKGTRMQLSITQPDDWHLHLRDGDLLEGVIPHSAKHFERAIVMPNLKPPITTTAAALAYRESILK
ncbi:hypothetical protein PIB30_094184 [Stylosanthes scabra]|uniref:Dihydroorotase n=1 Tax=Stylosanthes scabra TaxID=79078 RepID=A0ABU6ZTZ8_9FABA|nr:hypothetical protein [Stylosanthes scabra]